MFLIWIAHCVWQDEDRGSIGRYIISSMVWASVEEHRRLKKGKDIKQELLLTIHIVVYIVETLNAFRILVEKLKERDHFAEVGLVGSTI
jgi:hypothetical protein